MNIKFSILALCRILGFILQEFPQKMSSKVMGIFVIKGRRDFGSENGGTFLWIFV